MPKGLTFLSAAVFAATLAMPIVAQAEPDADTVVATVNGEDITLGHMIVLREALPQQYQELPAETLYETMLEQLIQQVALKQSLTGETPRFVALSLENEERSQLAALAIEDTISAITEEEARAHDLRRQTARSGVHETRRSGGKRHSLCARTLATLRAGHAVFGIRADDEATRG